MGENTDTRETLLTKREAAWRVNRHPRTIEHWVHTGRLRTAMDDGIKVYFRAEDVDQCVLRKPAPVKKEFAEFLTGDARAQFAAEARMRYENGTSIRQIATTLGTGEGTARNILAEAGVVFRASSHKTVYIYSLLDKQGQHKYVGHTVRDPEQRSWSHWADARSSKKRKCHKDVVEWLLTLDRRPDTRILEIVPYENRFAAEEKWTKNLLAQGAELLNCNAGAKQGLTERGREALDRRASTQSKRTYSTEARQEMSKRRQAWWDSLTEAERKTQAEKIKNAQRPLDDIAKERIGQASRDRWADSAKRADMIAKMRNARRSSAGREKIREAQKAKWEDPEYKKEQVSGLLKRYVCECGKESTPGAMSGHLRVSGHQLLLGEIGNSKTTKWRRTGSTIDLSQGG